MPNDKRFIDEKEPEEMEDETYWQFAWNLIDSVFKPSLVFFLRKTIDFNLPRVDWLVVK